VVIIFGLVWQGGGVAIAAVDLMERLVEKGIITEQERKELEKQEDTTTRATTSARNAASASIGSSRATATNSRRTFSGSTRRDPTTATWTTRAFGSSISWPFEWVGETEEL
jgi:hypothetical protein